MAFVSSGNQRGGWLFRVILGNPAHFDTAVEQSRATRLWALMVAAALTLLLGAALILIAPSQLQTGRAIASQALVAAGICLVLIDAFFLDVTAVPFTGESSREQPNLALTVLKYFAFFPLIVALPARLEPLIEMRPARFFVVAAVFGAAHLLLRRRRRNILRDLANRIALEDDEEDFPMKLGLRH
jgi:hypothetical protein